MITIPGKDRLEHGSCFVALKGVRAHMINSFYFTEERRDRQQQRRPKEGEGGGEEKSTCSQAVGQNTK